MGESVSTESSPFVVVVGERVVEFGVAGVQRQQDIDDSGWLGKATFNTLRSIVIPEGLNHAGDMAMDAYAAELLRDAWDLFGGHEPADSSWRDAVLERAVGEIGVKENPPDTNNVKYCDWYGMVGPWCAMFVTWCHETEGVDSAFVQGSRYAYVPYILADARAGRYGLKTVDDPIPGDLVLYDWAFDGEFDHIGVFEGWKGDEFTAIEGNTSVSNNSNGGEVMRRTRVLGQQATEFVRVT